MLKTYSGCALKLTKGPSGRFGRGAGAEKLALVTAFGSNDQSTLTGSYRKGGSIPILLDDDE